jgi:hypothetical protein
MTGAMNQVFKPSTVQNYIRLNTYETSAKYMLASGNYIWTIKKVYEEKYNFFFYKCKVKT